jgi:hypothetical protein
MRKLNIFDDGVFVARITVIDNMSFLFARSSREWSDMKRLLDASEKLKEADPSIDVLDNLISMLHNFNFSTELTDEQH